MDDKDGFGCEKRLRHESMQMVKILNVSRLNHSETFLSFEITTIQMILVYFVKRFTDSESMVKLFL